MEKILRSSGLEFHALAGEKREAEKGEPATRRKKAMPEAKKEQAASPAEEKPVEAEESLTQCEHCGEMFRPGKPGQTYCSKEACQKARKRAYMQEWHARHKQGDGAPDSHGTVPFAGEQPGSTLVEEAPSAA